MEEKIVIDTLKEYGFLPTCLGFERLRQVVTDGVRFTSEGKTYGEMELFYKQREREGESVSIGAINNSINREIVRAWSIETSRIRKEFPTKPNMYLVIKTLIYEILTKGHK